MGAPPVGSTQAGRANPIGIPYLYVASDAVTAVSECRPHKGDMVSVISFVTKKELNLVDLRNPRKLISPFSIADDELAKLYEDINYLCRLGEELTKVVLPKHAQLEYLPSQLLCELIKQSKFDGVVYCSAMGEGDNYVLFSEGVVEGQKVESYEVEKVKVSISKD